ncbi:hypothetical protein [Pedobacter jeongneungensis]|uniref:hypothetical protein n=1 Tax=Pedobacter jeongneungensis TaxID=947309 RepID=UPI00046AEF3D|nr:hypothetical protein [Pedobacter jeongneungensis]
MEPKIRKMAMVFNQVRMEDEDALDIAFWLNQAPEERLKTVVSLRESYFTWLNGSFPEKMERVITRRKL